MNDRINFLAKESGVQLDNNLNKFAELLLNDIDDIVNQMYHQLPLEKAVILLDLDEKIKRHFYEKSLQKV